MDLLYGGPRDESAEELVLELLNCSLFLYSAESRLWTRQAPGDLCRVLVFARPAKCEVLTRQCWAVARVGSFPSQHKARGTIH